MQIELCPRIPPLLNADKASVPDVIASRGNRRCNREQKDKVEDSDKGDYQLLFLLPTRRDWSWIESGLASLTSVSEIGKAFLKSRCN